MSDNMKDSIKLILLVNYPILFAIIALLKFSGVINPPWILVTAIIWVPMVSLLVISLLIIIDSRYDNEEK